MNSTTTSLSNISILLVEDDPDLIEEFTSVLQSEGADVTVKPSIYGPMSGVLPVLKDPGRTFHLVIFDTLLPETDEQWERAKTMIQKYSELSKSLRQQIDTEKFELETRTRSELAAVRNEYRKCLNREGALVVLRDLQESKRRILCPILFLTSRAEPQIHEESIQLASEVSDGRATQYLVKPVTGKLLLERVTRLVAREG